jgi:hypothetical protein
LKDEIKTHYNIDKKAKKKLEIKTMRIKLENIIPSI